MATHFTFIWFLIRTVHYMNMRLQFTLSEDIVHIEIQCPPSYGQLLYEAQIYFSLRLGGYTHTLLKSKCHSIFMFFHSMFLQVVLRVPNMGTTYVYTIFLWNGLLSMVP